MSSSLPDLQLLDKSRDPLMELGTELQWLLLPHSQPSDIPAREVSSSLPDLQLLDKSREKLMALGPQLLTPSSLSRLMDRNTRLGNKDSPIFHSVSGSRMLFPLQLCLAHLHIPEFV